MKDRIIKNEAKNTAPITQDDLTSKQKFLLGSFFN